MALLNSSGNYSINSVQSNILLYGGISMLSKIIKLYDDKEDVTLTTYIVADSGELSEIGNRPAVIICPGGAYIFCSDREAEPVALRFAAMGYHAFVLRYSTAGERKSKERNKDCRHPIPLRDLGKAMLTIRENADKWQVDVDRIAVCGFSAGAHNAALYSTCWHTPILSDYFGVNSEMFRPAAAILSYGLSDYSYLFEKEKDPYCKQLNKTSKTALLGDEYQSIEKLKEVSPYLHISKLTPPTFLWATAEDEIVPVQHSLQMAQGLAEHKIPFEMHIFEKGSHGLSLATQASAVAKSLINTDVAKWADLAEAWLEKRFALNLPEKVRV